MQMIDVITKLREIAERSPEEIGRAIASAEKLSNANAVVEAESKKKPDADGDGVPDWADKKPGKDDNEDKEDIEQRVDMKGKKCTSCKKGTYQETSQMDDMDGVIHCTKCGKGVKRHQKAQAKTNDGEKKGMSDKQAKYFGKKVDEDISITLSGSDAVLAEILKLAGMIGAKTTKGPDMVTAPAAPNPTLGMPTPVPPLPALGSPGGPMGPSIPDDSFGDMGSEPMMDDAFSASTTPNPTTMGMSAAIPSGNDLAKPKITTPMTSPGNNPMHTAISFD